MFGVGTLPPAMPPPWCVMSLKPKSSATIKITLGGRGNEVPVDEAWFAFDKSDCQVIDCGGPYCFRSMYLTVKSTTPAWPPAAKNPAVPNRRMSSSPHEIFLSIFRLLLFFDAGKLRLKPFPHFYGRAPRRQAEPVAIFPYAQRAVVDFFCLLQEHWIKALQGQRWNDVVKN